MAIGQIDVEVRADLSAYEAGLKTARKQADVFDLNMKRSGFGRDAVKLTTQQVQQLGYQFNDLGVQLASGGSPFMAIIQQGAQISQVLGNRGVKGAVTALAQGFTGFLTPMNLAVVGVAGLSVAIPALYNAIANSGSAQTSLEQQNELLDAMASKYEQVKAALDALEAGAQFATLSSDTDRLQTELDRATQALADSRGELGNYFNRLSNLAELYGQDLTPAQKAFVDQISQAARELDAGSITVAEYQERLTAIAQSTPDERIADLTRELRDSVDPLYKAEQLVNKLAASLRGLGTAANSVNISAVAESARLKLAGAYEAANSGRNSPYQENLDATYKLRDKAMSKSGGGSRTDAYKSEVTSIQERIQALQTEAATYGMTESAAAAYRVERELLNAAAKDGTAATAAEREQISQLVAQYQAANDNVNALEQRQRSAASAAQYFGNQALNVFGQFTSQIKTGNKALDSLLQSLIKVTAQSFLLGTGPFGGLFGGGAKRGGVGGILGGLLGFATGGSFEVGGSGGVDSQLVAFKATPGEKVNVTRPGQSAGGAPVVNINIDATGADAAGLARVENEIRDLKRTLPETIVSVTGQQQARGVVG